MDSFFHPFFVHFPVALLFFSFVAICVSFFYKPIELRSVSYWTLIGGVVGAILALISGDLNGGETERTKIIHEAIELHENAAWISVWIFSMLLAWIIFRFKEMKRKELFLFSVLHLIGLAVILYTSHLGGGLVRDHGVGVKPMKQEILNERQREQNSLRESQTL